MRLLLMLLLCRVSLSLMYLLMINELKSIYFKFEINQMKAFLSSTCIGWVGCWELIMVFVGTMAVFEEFGLTPP